MKRLVFIVVILVSCNNDDLPEVDMNTSDTYDLGSRDSDRVDRSQRDADVPSILDTSSDQDVYGEPDADLPLPTFPTLADYRKCQTDVDCPVGLGECLKEISLSRPDATLGEVVKLSDHIPGLAAGEGICTRSCVTDESACQTLSLRNPDGEKVPFVCQVVVVGDLAYPSSPPDFPFDTALDFEKMALARSFASLCRPPFELDPSHIEDFCGACDDQSGCAEGTCWNFSKGPVGTGEMGVCLEADTAGCPLGFESRDLRDGDTSLGKHCVPLTETCGACQDRDNDGHGAGHCAQKEIDCDDKNENAYYNPANMDHAFPTYCGEQDYNCNGLSDDSEQVGLAQYKQNHCEFCFDDLDGKLVLAGQPEEALLACLDGKMVIQNCTSDTQIHCQGDVRMTGCEANAVAGNGILYYQDLDNDNFGNPNESSLGCAAGAPVGFVVDNTDCDDSRAFVNPGITSDRCDCWGDCLDPANNLDNDCDGEVDEDVEKYNWLIDRDNDGVGESLTLDNGSPVARCGRVSANTIPQETQFQGALLLDCDDTRADIFPAHTRVEDGQGQPIPLPLLSEPPRDANGNLIWGLQNGATEVCDGVDNNCFEGIDEGVKTTFYEDKDEDTFGNHLSTSMACIAPNGYVSDNTDCKDDGMISGVLAKNIYPGAPEICENVDTDCDGLDDTSDVDVDLTGTCNTGLPGRCSAGIANTCTNAGYGCQQLFQPEKFDDPALGTDDDCDGPEKIVYVDGTAGFDNPNPSEANNDGLNMTLAFKTVPAALNYAATINATQVFLRGGTYTISSPLILKNGIDIVGGFDATGTYKGASTTISKDSTVVSGNNIAIYAPSIVSPTTLAHLKIFTTSGVGMGTTNMGISATSSNALMLRDVTIDVSDASDGEESGTGKPAEDISGPSANGQPHLTPGVNTCPSTPGVNNLAKGGEGLIPGIANIAETGGHGNGAGGPIQDLRLNSGHDATNVASPGAGGTKSRLNILSANGKTILLSTSGTEPGDGEFGGGGGGSSVYLFGFAGAGGGAGGCPGKSGNNGKDGGSSIGVFSVHSLVSYENVTIKTGNGGKGGDGVGGGDGGDGGEGGLGTLTIRGGHGSGGSGGGGGASGQGGFSYPIWILGFTQNTCNGTSAPPGVTIPVSSVGGVAGVSGLGGQGGEFGGIANDDGNDGNNGLSGGRGNSAECRFAKPCFPGSFCPAGEYCSSGVCFERF